MNRNLEVEIVPDDWYEEVAMKTDMASVMMMEQQHSGRPPSFMFSGACKGADAFWSMMAAQLGHHVVHYSFKGHRPDVSKTRLVDIQVLTEEEMAMYNNQLAVIAQKLNRKWPPSNTFSRKFLQRDYHQSQNTDSLYAVGFLLLGNIAMREECSTAVAIEGGTAWACQAFIDTWILEHGPSCNMGTKLPFYFYDQTTHKWYQPSVSLILDDEVKGLDWKVMANLPPRPSGHYTAIGTRELKRDGEQAITSVFRQ